MHYFRVLGLIFGMIVLLKPVYLHVLPYDEHKLLEKVYSEDRPGWIIPVGILGLILVVFTWYKELSTEIKYPLSYCFLSCKKRPILYPQLKKVRFGDDILSLFRDISKCYLRFNVHGNKCL